MKELFKNKYVNKFLPLYVAILALILLLGSSYALFRSSHTSTNVYTMNVGLLEVNFYGTTNTLTYNNMYPMTDEEGLSLNNNVLNFTVKNTGNVEALYDVYIEETSTNPEFKSVIKYAVNKDDNGYGNALGLSNNMLYIDKEQVLDSNDTANYKVKFWLSETADNTYMNKTFTAKIVITSRQWEAPGKTTSELVTELITNNTVTDSGTTRYVTGQSTNNYLWYSGFLWRIISYDIDVSNNITNIKLVTQNNITPTDYGIDNDFSTSFIKTWLNEDFYDVLYHSSNIIKTDSVWNDGENDTIAPVGLLTDSEYTIVGGSSSYLNIYSCWWTMTKIDTKIRYVEFNGEMFNFSPTSNSNARPSVNLKTTINFSGSGTLSNPYKIIEDVEKGQTGENLNTRQVGEYVLFKDKLFRIVGIENNNTKLVSVDYVRDATNDISKKNFSSTAYFGSSIADDTKWDGYLNTTWLNKNEINTTSLLSSTERDVYLAQGTYYLGEFQNGGNYKGTICNDTTVKVSECTNFISNQFVGYVGLLRVGEMFASQEKKINDVSSSIWLITPKTTQYSGIEVRCLYSDGRLQSFPPVPSSSYSSPSVSSNAVHPSIHLKSNIKIAACSTELCDGTKEHPYEVEL